MPIVPTKPPTGPLTVSRIVEALTEERDFANSGIGFDVTSARYEGNSMVVGIERHKGRRSLAIEETLEGCQAVWGKELENRGEVFVVNTDAAEIVLRFAHGRLPDNGEHILLYQRDFLTPLIDLWLSDLSLKALRATDEKEPRQLYVEKPLPKGFNNLRERQKDALLASLYRSALIIGPPGTGKTYTTGALIAYLLSRFKNSRILLIGPTNVAVDTALMAADDWLERLTFVQHRASMKRIGSRFDARKYRERVHLLASGVAEAATQVAMLESDEPSRSDISKYVSWKEQLERARAALKVDVHKIASSSRLVAITAASLFIWQDIVRSAGPWHFMICDEASQVFAPAALMLTTFSSQSIFAGDPNQLSPVVQTPSREAQSILSQTAFQTVKRAKKVQLNEQSRMSHAICDAVAATFYDGDLKVCRKARKDHQWKKSRSPYYVDGREVPRVMFDNRASDATWSTKYNGLIRYSSANLVAAYVAEFLGSYADAKDILVLTPFRAQRALLRIFFKNDNLGEVRISTVHKSQGSESKIVIFDPVDASAAFLNSEEGKRLINVALSRAQAHAVFIVNSSDFSNPWMQKLYIRTSSLWLKKGDYASPFFVKMPRGSL